jgi:hypothetical protein
VGQLFSNLSFPRYSNGQSGQHHQALLLTIPDRIDALQRFRRLQAVIKTISQGTHEQDAVLGPSFSIETTSGVTYQGRLHNGYMHGKVSMMFPDNTCFDGRCSSNTLTGLGVTSYEMMRYHGELLNGEHHGNGVLEVMGGGARYSGVPHSPVCCRANRIQDHSLQCKVNITNEKLLPRPSVLSRGVVSMAAKAIHRWKANATGNNTC